MYRVIGREKISGSRFGRYLVEFSVKWPPGADYLYLVAPFTSFFPGRFELAREGERGRVFVPLWEGFYPYRYAATCGVSLLDDENPSRVKLRLWPESSSEEEFSLAEVGVGEHLRSVRERRLEPELVVHDERDPVFISKYLGYTVLRLKAPAGVLSRVYAEPAPGRIVEMEKYLGTELVDYFQGILDGDVREYRFILEVGGEKVYYGEEGLGDEKPIRPAKLCGVDEASWYIGCTYYLVFPDSFTRRGVSVAGSRPRARLGGTLRDIAESLDYIASLGVDAIYLTPIYKSVSYHGYDVIDHKEVDESLGGWGDWDRLVSEASKRGLKIVVDIVAHHVSPCSYEFRRAVLDDCPEYRDWFRFYNGQGGAEVELLKKFVSGGCREFPGELRGRRPFYETFLCNWGMPKLNYGNKRVVERLVDVASFWLERGASGLRIDVGHAIPDDALRQLYARVKELKRDAPVILEVSKGVAFYPYGITSDSAMNYDLRELLLAFVVSRSMDAESFVRRLKELYVSVPVFAANSMYNLLGSHDTPRIATLADKCGHECLELLYVILFSLPGSPSIYYGDEVGTRGGHDPDNRLLMVWEEEKWDRSLFCLVRRLAMLRKTLAPLRLGFFDTSPLGPSSISVFREWRGEEVRVVVSVDDSQAIQLGDKYFDVLGNKPVESVELQPYSWRILYRRKKHLDFLLLSPQE
ncbi:hypothetical protein IG193_01265 [Infirmifilum lucidum]|uniref:Glycosyl hydrolase family 13 catalytic domain-containing protein n=1 Tax=Infirmifilum lucidum TaxID=2776706 RepID=A0A7L9FK02_9CREN|nr:alpha-amylase family glycosyl hydrolase [Infirmifilum lucidum]QOJ79125.1 hypothetical protein IG193_01265 [Infirmifilum lucidum]